MEQKQRENEEYIARKNAEIAELEREQDRTRMKKLERKGDGKSTILVLGGYKSRKMHLLNRDRTRWSTLSLKLPTSLNSGGAACLDEEIYLFGRWELKMTYKLNREMEWIQLADMNGERSTISNICHLLLVGIQ